MINHAFRLAKAAFTFAREGVFGLIEPQNLPPLARFGLRVIRLVEKRKLDANNRLSTALTKLGPSYVKLGQFMATRPDIVGRQMALNLTALQDAVPPFSQEEAERLILEGLGKPVHEIFSSFSAPVAAASVAQVHKAVYQGRDVAVKILRPNVADRFRKDLGDFYFAARLLNLIPSQKRLKHHLVVDGLARSVALEMDLRLEAAALSECRENCANDKDFYVPEVMWAQVSKNVLTLEWIDGIKLNNVPAIEAAGHDLKRLAAILIQSFLRNALRDGFFHADMHQGNLFVDKKGRLVAIDFGIMGRLGEKERLLQAEILYGFITRDYKRVSEQHFLAGYVPKHHSVEEFAQAIRAIGEPIHSQTADQISMAKLLGLLFDVTAIFNMETRPELVLLQKTMVVVEGVARTLDPEFNLWMASESVIEGWLRERLGVQGKLEEASRHVNKALTMIADTPDLFQRIKDLTSMPVEASKSHNNLLNIGIWVIAALLALGLILK